MAMQAPTPLWLARPYEPRPPLEGGADVDVCVIGGGIGGLSCARDLAPRGLDVLLLEGATVAGGASGRHGGFLPARPAAVPLRARGRDRGARPPRPSAPPRRPPGGA